MENKIAIVSKRKTNLLDSIIYWMEKEKTNYEILETMDQLSADFADSIIYINYEDSNDLLSYKLNIPLIIVSKKQILIDNTECKVNYVITPLVEDTTEYTYVQKEYLFQKGLYNVVVNKVLDFINKPDDLSGLVIDTTHCNDCIKDWVFKFDSISETYTWLSKMNLRDDGFTEKIVNFYHEKIYNDSSKEINYLATKIENIKNNKKSIDLFICTKSELDILKTNYFFKLLLKNISKTHHMYVIDRDILIERELNIYNKLLDGVAIYNDCVYIDTFDDEYSLGKVDCKKETILEYNKYFDYIVNEYGKRLYSEEDINGI